MGYIKDKRKDKQAESNPGAGEPSFGVNALLRQCDANVNLAEISEGGLLYPNPAANLVGE